MRKLLILVVFFVVGCAPIPFLKADDNVAERDGLYWATAASIVADSYSTWRALKVEGTQEAGYIMNELYGPQPSDKDIIEFTILNLALLEWSRSWNPHNRKTLQYTIVVTKGLAVANNVTFWF